MSGIDGKGPPRKAKRMRLTERTMLACVHCKGKKLKCDGATPTCQKCVKSSRDCLVEDPATGLHRPRNYVQTLESRIAQLESLLRDVNPLIASDHMSSGRQAGPAQSTSQAGVSSPSITAGADPGATPNGPTTNDIPSEVALLCLSAAGREPHYFGASSAVSFSRVASQLMGLKESSGSSHPDTITSPGKRQAISESDIATERPTKDIVRALEKAYFENIHPQYPFLHRPTFNGWQKEHEQHSQPGREANHAASFFCLMVYAIGSLALGQRYQDEAESFYTMAYEHMIHILDSDSLESLQAILACAVYSIRSPTGASLWKISGMAIRMCVELGYHRSSEKFSRARDPLMREMSKRCFWVAYDIERVVCSILGRPSGIPDSAIDAELPLDIDDDEITETGYLRGPGGRQTMMTGAIHIIKLRQLWSRFGAYVSPGSLACSAGCAVKFPSIETLRQQLEEWRVSVPTISHSSFAKPLSVFSSQDWFDLAYNHSILLLYRPLLGNSAGSPDEVDAAFAECYTKARDLCLRYRQLSQTHTVQFTWDSLHILFLGGLTYCFCLWRSKAVRTSTKLSEAMGTCMACTTVLTIIAERWKLATPYRDIFETLSQRTINMMCRETEKNRTAYHQNVAIEAEVVAFEDWLTDLSNLTIPPETAWLMQEFESDLQHPSMIVY